MRKPKVSLEYVRALPGPIESIPELSRTAGSFDLNAVKNKIEKATSSVCHTWDQRGGYLRANHMPSGRNRAMSGFISGTVSEN